MSYRLKGYFLQNSTYYDAGEGPFLKTEGSAFEGIISLTNNHFFGTLTENEGIQNNYNLKSKINLSKKLYESEIQGNISKDNDLTIIEFEKKYSPSLIICPVNYYLWKQRNNTEGIYKAIWYANYYTFASEEFKLQKENELKKELPQSRNLIFENFKNERKNFTPYGIYAPKLYWNPEQSGMSEIEIIKI